MYTINNVMIWLNTTLSRRLNSSGAVRLAIIGALIWLAGGLPTTVAYGQAAGSTIIVNSASDGGFIFIDPRFPTPAPVCTLRDAITAANTNRAVAGCAAGTPSPRVDTILFNLGTGTPVINVRSQLPPILEPVVINGGSFGATRVELEGTRASFVASITGQRAHGLFLAAGDSTIRNMVINRFNGNGIVMTTFTGGSISDWTPPTITDPSIPTEPPCFARPAEPDCPPGGGGGGPDIPDIGGAGARNKVLGCFIGTDATGTLAFANGSGLDSAGIAADTDMHTIGGSTPSDRNVISGNFGQGLILGGRGHSVRGNFIGTDVSGNLPLGNQFDGINIAGGRFSNAMGSIGANTIASDAVCGIVSGNDRPQCGNRIAFNGHNGINVGFNRYAILSNAIFSNGLLGIDIDGPGVTPNANNRSRNTPVLGPYWALVIDLSIGRIVLNIDVTVSNFPDQPTTVQIFRNSACDPSGFGEGEQLVKTIIGLRNGRHRIQIPASSGTFTATATTTLVLPQTSGFSSCFRAGIGAGTPIFQ